MYNFVCNSERTEIKNICRDGEYCAPRDEVTVENYIRNNFIVCALHLVLLLRKSRGINRGQVGCRKEITCTYIKNVVFWVVMLCSSEKAVSWITSVFRVKE
jgi:hypothetical protein